MMDIPANNSRFTVEHIRVTSDRSFDDVADALVQQLVPFDLSGLLVELAAGGDAEAIRARLEALVSPSGLMLFGERDHGLLLRLAGQQRKAVQYDVGNPLFAIQMTRHDLRAGLYVPLRLLLYEYDTGKTCLEYDRPSSLLGQFGDERIAPMAASLDRKLEELAVAAMR
jgi:uncharacterized protein (DUF302 family)